MTPIHVQPEKTAEIAVLLVNTWMSDSAPAILPRFAGHA